MSCASPSRELLTPWLAGTLEPHQASEVARHVEGCADCQSDAADGRTLVAGLRQLHLTAGEIVAAAADELHSPHLLVCAPCRDEVALLRVVNADLARGTHAPALRRRWRAAALGAGVAAVIVALVWIGPWRHAEDTLRGRTPASIEVQPVTTLADAVPTFRWTPLAGAARYRLTVFAEDGREVWTREAPAPPARWPADVLRSPGRYRWWVEALDTDGRLLVRSRLSNLEVAR